MREMDFAVTASFLLDVKEGRLIKEPVILVKGPLIQKVDSRENIELPPSDSVYNLTGKTLIPGLIDSHVHLGQIGATESETGSVKELIPFQTARAVGCLRLDLEAGITTIRAVCDKGFLDVGLKQAIHAGYIQGPRLFTCGHMLCITGGRDSFVPGLKFDQSRFWDCDSVAECIRAVRYQLKFNVDWVKLGITGSAILGEAAPAVQQFNFEELQAIIKVAHMAGKKVAGHVHWPGIQDSVKAGIDSIEHGRLATEEDFVLMADQGTYFIPTLSTYYFILKHGVESGIPSKNVDRTKTVMDEHFAGLKKAMQCGVKIVMGTDTGMPFNYHGNNPFELQLMTEGGMGNLAAIRSATLVAAEMLGVQEKIGSIEEGKYADIIAVDGNPLEDIKVLQDVSFVMKDGQVVKDCSMTRNKDSKIF